MGTAERRNLILKTLCRRRHETIGNLAAEFGVSERTIRRDIEVLSCSAPIYTQTGRYCGGVYVVDGYTMDRMYMEEYEIAVLQKICALAEEQQELLSNHERSIIKRIIGNYSRPQYI